MTKKNDRSPAFNRGRWQVERERHQLTDRRPPPPLRDAMPIREAVEGLLRRLGLEEEHWVTVLSEKWVELVGAAVAAHARPGKVEKGQLTVFVDNSVWLSELARHGQSDLLRKLQDLFGPKSIKHLRFQLDPEQDLYRSDGRGRTRPASSRR